MLPLVHTLEEHSALSRATVQETQGWKQTQETGILELLVFLFSGPHKPYEKELGQMKASCSHNILLIFFLSFFFNPHSRIYLLVFRERGRRGREREKNIDQLHSCHMHHDQGLNPQPFGVWDVTPTN